MNALCNPSVLSLVLQMIFSGRAFPPRLKARKNRYGSYPFFLCLTFLLLALVSPEPPEPLTLSQAIQLMQQNNLELKQLKAEIQRMRAKRSEAFALTGPTVRFTSSYAESQGTFGGFFAGVSLPGVGVGFSPAQNQPPTEILTGTQTTKSLTGVASYLLYSGGKIESFRKQAFLGFSIAQANYEKRKNELSLETLKVYLTVLQAKHSQEVAESTLMSLEELLRVTQKRFEAGTAPKVEVLRAEAEVSNARVQAIQAKNLAQTSYASLMNLLNLPQESVFDLSEVELPEEQVNMTLKEAKLTALQNRPEVRIGEWSVAQRQAGIRAYKADRYPSFSISHTRSWLESPFFADKTSWSVALQGTLNIFDTGLTNARIHQAVEEWHKAELDFQRLKAGIELEVTQAFLNLNASEQAYEAAEKGVDTAKEALRIARLRYETGFGTQVEVLDAQAAYSRAQFNYYKALYDLLIARASFSKSLARPLP